MSWARASVGTFLSPITESEGLFRRHNVAIRLEANASTPHPA
jgi:hypothetical protein